MIKLFGKELNLEEMFVGVMIQWPFYFAIGWWVLLLMPISGLLWALGGAEKSNKLWRRLGVPLATSIAIIAYNVKLWPAGVAFLPAFGVLSMGYGESSWLYKLYSKWFKEDVIDYPIRITTYILYWFFYAIGFICVK